MTAHTQPAADQAGPSTPPLTGFLDLPIGDLYESSTNPRKFYDQDALLKLTHDVARRGILQPILVRHRPTADGLYEIIAGSRRFRAAKAADLATVPCRVVQMTDDEVVETQVVENLQREDVHPLDEADGYHAMITRHGYDTAAIAAKIGKSESYVLKRLKLQALITAAKQAGWAGTLTVGHLLLLARLQPKDQERALTECLENEYGFGSGRDAEPMSVKALARFIQEEIILDLTSARCVFDKDDPSLLPGAGSCVDCPKRTGHNLALFEDIGKHDLCTDPTCFTAKTHAHFERLKRAAATETKNKVVELSTDTYFGFGEKKPKHLLLKDDWASAKPGSCTHLVTGVVVHGEKSLGQTLTVCTDKQCSTHFKRQYGQTMPVDRHSKVPPTAQEKAARSREQRKAKVEAAYRRLLFGAVSERAAMNGLDTEALRLVARQLLFRTWHEHRKWLCQVLALEPATGGFGKDYEAPLEQLVAQADRKALEVFLVQLCLAGDLHGGSDFRGGGKDVLEETAKRYRLDLGGVKRQAEELVEGEEGRAGDTGLGGREEARDGQEPEEESAGRDDHRQRQGHRGQSIEEDRGREARCTCASPTMNGWVRFKCAIGAHEMREAWAVLPCASDFDGLPDLLAAALPIKAIRVHQPRFGMVTLTYDKCRHCGALAMAASPWRMP
ncbi:ParB/RepB/Spo0J family partition protein [Candidatus Nitrospira bockiana]